MWLRLSVLPCTGVGAFMTLPPKACPIAWWPRHTPNRGMSVLAAKFIRSRQIPASLGVQGPGESTRAFGALSMTSCAVL